MAFVFTLVLLVLHMCTCEVQGTTEVYEVELNTNFSLPCDYIDHNLSYPGSAWPFKRYWVLPNATVIDDNYEGDKKFSIMSTNVYTFILTITGIDIQDFGIYECVMIWNNMDYKANVIRIELTEYDMESTSVEERLKENILVGSVVGAATVVTIIIVGHILLKVCFHKAHAHGLPSNAALQLTNHERVAHHM